MDGMVPRSMSTRDALIDLAGVVGTLAAAISAQGEAIGCLAAALEHNDETTGSTRRLASVVENLRLGQDHNRSAYTEILSILDRLGSDG